MARRARAPEAVKVDLSQGDWLLLKKRLTAGEARAAFTRMVKTMNPGEKIELDPEFVGLSKIVAYLIDWGTFLDSAGNPLVIRGKSSEHVESILKALDQDDFEEINQAVEAHIERMEAEAEQEKNAQDGANVSSAISPSAE